VHKASNGWSIFGFFPNCDLIDQAPKELCIAEVIEADKKVSGERDSVWRTRPDLR
jgi:hypothetical protein